MGIINNLMKIPPFSRLNKPYRIHFPLHVLPGDSIVKGEKTLIIFEEATTIRDAVALKKLEEYAKKNRKKVLKND